MAAPKTGASASKISMLNADLTVFPEFSISARVLNPSQKSWEITARATTIPKPNSNWNPIPIARSSRNPGEQNSVVENNPIFLRFIFLFSLVTELRVLKRPLSSKKRNKNPAIAVINWIPNENWVLRARTAMVGNRSKSANYIGSQLQMHTQLRCFC